MDEIAREIRQNITINETSYCEFTFHSIMSSAHILSKDVHGPVMFLEHIRYALLAGITLPASMGLII